MRIAGDWLSRQQTQGVMAALVTGGHRALFVGGCVRDAILGRAVLDVDIATDALPDEVTRLATQAGYAAVPTGIAHGTVTVVADGVPHEVTTFRRDVTTDGRHAEVAFSDSIAEDASRRDFTMNALYADAGGAVIDPLGGLPDLLSRQVRFVGAPVARIREDTLRILRFFRFLAWYGDPAQGPDPDALSACGSQAGGLDGLSRERVGQEMRKLLAAPDPAPSLGAMAQAGILGRVLPGADPRAVSVLVHLERCAPSSWTARLAVLGGADPATALRLTNREEAALTILRDGVAGMAAPAELGWRHGEGVAVEVCRARAAVMQGPLPDGWQDAIRRGAAARFPVTAADLMPRFAGAELGRALRAMEALWIASDFRLTRADLIG